LTFQSQPSLGQKRSQLFSGAKPIIH